MTLKIKKILLTILILFILQSLQAQLALAKLKFEDAETAYNAGSYETALSKLVDAEKLFGKINPPILHLRILCRDKIFESNKRWGLLDSLRTEAKYFLASYADVEGLEEKYRDVYRIQEKRSELPNDKLSFESYLQTEEKTAIDKFDQANPATVYVLRKTGFDASAVGFPIFVDGENLCKLNTGNFMMVKLRKGKHGFSVQLKGQVLKKETNQLEIDLFTGKVYYLNVRLNHWNGKVHLEIMNDTEGTELLRKLVQDTCK